MEKIRIGIVGLGIIAERLMKGFTARQDMVVTAVCEVNEQRLAAVESQLGHVLATTDYRVLVTSPDVDLVYIAVPPSFHAEVAIAAMKAGKHVFSEKPLANSMEEADAMLQVAKETGVVTAMNFPLQYSAEVAEFERLVKSGFLGKLELVELSMRFPEWPRGWQQNSWVSGRAQGGFTLEVGVHFIQTMQRIFGSVSNIQSRMTYPANPDASELTVTATASLANGDVPVVIHGLGNAGGEERIAFNAYGDKGEISLRNWGQLFKAQRGQALVQVQDAAAPSFGGLLDNVVRAIRGDQAVVCDFEVGYAAQQVLEALRRQ